VIGVWLGKDVGGSEGVRGSGSREQGVLGIGGSTED
jgi:hypothetical protein